MKGTHTQWMYSILPFIVETLYNGDCAQLAAPTFLLHTLFDTNMQILKHFYNHLGSLGILKRILTNFDLNRIKIESLKSYQRRLRIEGSLPRVFLVQLQRLKQDILFYNESTSLTIGEVVRLTSCLIGLDLIKQVKLLLMQHKQSSQIGTK